MDKTEKLIEQLKKTHRIKNIRLANSISKIHNGYIFGKKEGKRLQKNEKKAYKLLLKLLPPEARERIKDIDQSTSAIIDYIERRTGWYYTEKGFFYRDNFHNMDDPEFRSFDTYSIPRDENGFHLDTEGKPKYIANKERMFFMKYCDLLKLLQEYFDEKKQLINDRIILSDDRELAESLAIFLGYEEETSEEKTNRK